MTSVNSLETHHQAYMAEITLSFHNLYLSSQKISMGVKARGQRLWVEGRMSCINGPAGIMGIHDPRWEIYKRHLVSKSPFILNDSKGG